MIKLKADSSDYFAKKKFIYRVFKRDLIKKQHKNLKKIYTVEEYIFE